MTATIFSGPAGSLVNPTATITAGVATFSGFQLNGPTGSYVLRFSDGTRTVNSVSIALGVGAAASVVFDAAGTPGAAATNGMSLPTQPIVKVVDAGGNLVTGASGTMTATIFSGTGGSLTGTTTATITLGVATFTTLGLNGTVGSFVLRFSDGTRTVNSVSIALAAGAAATMNIVLGNTQSVIAGGAFTDSIKVKVVDVGLNGVAGVSVSFTTSNGTALPTSASTDASGFVATAWTPGTVAGAVALTASTLAGSAPSAPFTGTVTHAAAAKLLMFVEPSATATHNAPFTTQPKVKIADTFGNAVTTGASATAVVNVVYNPAGLSTLGGTASASAVAGIASFAGLKVLLAGGATPDTGTLTFDSGLLTSVTTATTIATTP